MQPYWIISNFLSPLYSPLYCQLLTLQGYIPISSPAPACEFRNSNLLEKLTQDCGCAKHTCSDQPKGQRCTCTYHLAGICKTTFCSLSIYTAWHKQMLNFTKFSIQNKIWKRLQVFIQYSCFLIFPPRILIRTCMTWNAVMLHQLAEAVRGQALEAGLVTSRLSWV